jgi:RNA polymerase sigma factor (sigma-70 family)
METTSHVLGRLAARRLGDAGLFEHARSGDPAAFSEVYRRYQKRVYGFCLARTADPGAAADATQEVFLRLLRSAPGEIENPKAWLFTVARNVSVDALRKRAHLNEAGDIAEDSPAWASLTAADTADEVLGRSEGTTVFLALRSLNARQRTALILREIHGQSSKDMAEALGSTPGAVDTLVSRARDAFGIAYAVASGLPPACRASVELMYRRRGTGITTQEALGLDAHLAGCERCRAEAAKADDPRHLGALLPFLVPAQRAGGILRRLALAGHPFSEVAAQAGASVGSQPHVWTAASKVAAGLLVAAMVAVPVASGVARRASVAAVQTAASARSRANTGMASPGAASKAAPGRAMRASAPAAMSAAKRSSGSAARHMAKSPMPIRPASAGHGTPGGMKARSAAGGMSSPGGASPPAGSGSMGSGGPGH